MRVAEGRIGRLWIEVEPDGSTSRSTLSSRMPAERANFAFAMRRRAPGDILGDNRIVDGAEE